MRLPGINIHLELSDKDKAFFESHWLQWVKRNPPPKNWTGTIKEWAETEMPCIGWIGRALYWLEKDL